MSISVFKFYLIKCIDYVCQRSNQCTDVSIASRKRWSVETEVLSRLLPGSKMLVSAKDLMPLGFI